MKEERPEMPFKNLGDRLKTIRQKLHESMAEVSGAVEIDEQKLQRIEQGHERPSEDILLLLINHFGIQDDDATSLWQLAGYDQPSDHDSHDEQQNNTRTMVMIMAVDPRIIYSDGVQISASKNGVVLNFSQGVGTPQVLTTARIGMSRENALVLIQNLQQALEGSKPKQLPPPASESNKQSKSSSDSNKKER